MTIYEVFYNPDCQMYGIKDKYGQVLPPRGKGARHGQSAYTHYKAVAERWAKQKNGDAQYAAYSLTQNN